MVDYIKEWRVDGRTLGIEDQEAVGDHFFPSEYAKGERGRFSVWIGGCGTGTFDSLDTALARAKEVANREASKNRALAETLIVKAREWDALDIS